LVAAVLRVAGVTAGLWRKVMAVYAGFVIYVTCRLTAKNRDQLRDPTLGNRVWATFLVWEAYRASPDLLAKFNGRRKEEQETEWVKHGWRNKGGKERRRKRKRIGIHPT